MSGFFGKADNFRELLIATAVTPFAVTYAKAG